MKEKYEEWSKNNTTGWLATEPTKLKFSSEPWEGQYGWNNVWEYVQFRNGKWHYVKQPGT